MDTILKFLENTPLLNIVFLFFAIIGITVSLYTYYKSKNISKPTYAKVDTNIISSSLSKIKNLSILYNEKTIEELSSCQVVLYNAGKKSIRKSDCAPKDKVRIVVDDGEILSHNIKYRTKEINNFQVKLSESKDSLLIDFDFLGHFDGAVVQILHTGKNVEKIEIKGTIIDSGNFIEYYKRFRFLKPLVGVRKIYERSKELLTLMIILTFPLFIIWFIFISYKYMRLSTLMPRQFMLSSKNWL